MEYLENLCRKLIRNEVDHFDLLAEGNKFKLDFSRADEFSHKKYLLKHAVLSEILKNQYLNESDRKKYEEMIETTSKFLKLQSSRLRGYPCSFVGCLFRGKRHRKYVFHLENTHASSAMFQCCFGQECIRNFGSISELKDHVKTVHERTSQGLGAPPGPAAGVQFQVSVKCSMLSCGGLILSSTKELTSHMNIKHKSENRDCIFKDCDTRFKPDAVSRNHFRQKHYIPNKVALKSVHVIGEVVPSPTLPVPANVIDEAENILNDAFVDECHGPESDSDDEVVDIEDPMEEDYYLKAYADFINRLITYKFIPVTSVRDIAAEFLNQSQRSSESRESVLRNSLSKIPGLSNEQIEQIVRENSEDPFTRAQEELSSEFKRNKFMEENFKFVKPQEIVLNKEEVQNGALKDVVHYVSLVEALKVLIEDKSFNKAFRMAEDDCDARHGDLLEDVRDGNAYKSNVFFRDNPEALAIMMYSDGVELTNPLSSGKGKHKIVQLFWTLCEIPRFQRSAIDRLQLGLVFKEKLLRKYSQADIFKSLLEDLSTLETVGVAVKEPFPRHVKAGLLLYSADNLEAHTIGGFSACFSSKDVCR